MLHRRHFCSGKKGGLGIGKTKRGKGTKIMAIADASGLPVALWTGGANTHEVKLVEPTLKARHISHKPIRLIGDMAYDSDPLDKQMRKQKIRMIAPNRNNRKKPATQDRRELRRYRRRWKIERLFAWIFNFRRCTTRYEVYPDNFLGFVQLAACIILLRHF